MADVIRIAEKTWKKNLHSCQICDEVIQEGVTFRLKTVKADKLEHLGAHITCVSTDPAWECFELVPEDEGLRPVREARGHRFRVDAEIVYCGLPGVITGGSGGLVTIRQNGITKPVDPWTLTLA